MTDKTDQSKLSYAAAGVDIDAGEEAVNKIKELAQKTFGPEVLSGIGAFGGFFKPDLGSLASPVFISSTDSVGTKLKLAFMTGRHDTVGEDLVNHCVNDILVHAARPLFFLDYIAVEKLDQEVVTGLVSGLSRGCVANGTALLGGETAELPDFYQPGEYDLAGFVVGVVEESKIINGSTIREGDVCIGLGSNGLHTNGYSLARKIVFELAGFKYDDTIPELGTTAAESLMKVHRSYLHLVQSVLDKIDIHGMAHITGGGIPGNLKRILPDSLDAEITKGSWPTLPIFEFLQKRGEIATEEMYRAFNMGIGFILVVPPESADQLLEEFDSLGETAYRIGRIVRGKKTVRMCD
jgi:phosphoribosylformylglycinamidine cyclo-ligase